MNLNQSNFESEVLRSDLPVLVDFSATWCGPCKMLSPVIEELARTYAGKVKVFKVDVDEAPELANQYRISAVPTLIVFKGGKVQETTTGFQSPRQLQALLDPFCAPAGGAA